MLPTGCLYFETLTRMLMRRHEGDDFTIDHGGRQEVCKTGALLGIDLSKVDTPLLVPETVTIRVIGRDAEHANLWVPLDVAPADIQTLVDAIDARDIRPQYRLAWQTLKQTDGVWSVRRPLTIKIAFALMPMDTSFRRAEYARLMTDYAGVPTMPDRSFNESALVRYAVTEVVDPAKPTPLSVYNKPVADASLHWRPLSEADVEARLLAHARAVPTDAIAAVRARMRRFYPENAGVDACE